MPKHALPVRVSKFFHNYLLNRKQMIVTVPQEGQPTISKEKLREQIASIFKADPNLVSVFGLKTNFGGAKTTGFALIYDDAESFKKIEPKYRQQRLIKDSGETIKTLRKQRKERKNREKKTRGTKQSNKRAKK